MNSWKLLLTAFSVFFAAAFSASAQNPTVAIRAGHLFDSKSGKLLENQIILIEGEKIKSVGPADSVSIPQGAQEIDLSKATVLPGLIDGHTHVFGFGLDGIKPGGPPFASPITDSREYRPMLACANAQKDLRAGYPPLRNWITNGVG